MRKYLKLVGILMLAANGVPAAAQETNEVTLVGDSWPPYIYGDVGGEAKGGVGVELLHEIFRRIDTVQLRFPLVPWNRALRAVEQGTHDGIGILLKTDEREQYMDYTEEVFRSFNTFWYTKKKFPDGFNWENYKDFAPYTIGLIQGHSYGKEFDQLVKIGALKTVSVSSADQLFAMLAKGRLDLVPANKLVGITYANALVNEGIIIQPTQKPSGIEIYYIAFSKKSSARHLIPQVNQVIRDLTEEGYITNLLEPELRPVAPNQASGAPIFPDDAPANAGE